MFIRRFVVGVVASGIMVLGMDMVSSQDYPNKSIRLIAPGAGGGGDSIARIIAQGISGPLGQQVVVDNRPGVTQQETVAKSVPDGYTLMVGGGSTWIAPLFRKVPYDMKDFAPITSVERTPVVLAVHPSVPVKSVKELIALAKAKPGALNYGASPAGTSYIAVELFKSMAGIDIAWVPYRSSGHVMTSLIGGEVQLTIIDPILVSPQVKSGKLRALAVTSSGPSALFPGLPTIASSGLPGYETVNTTGIFSPAKTPGAIISRLNQELVRFLNQVDVKGQFLNAGVEIVTSSPEEFGAKVQSEIARVGKLIKDAGIKTE